VIRQIRAFLLERGIAVRQGQRFLRSELPILLASRMDACRRAGRECSMYLRAKVAREKLIKASGIPYAILRSTRFFEFIGRQEAISLPFEHSQRETTHDQAILLRSVVCSRLHQRGACP
jgi:hypothetical protein